MKIRHGKVLAIVTLIILALVVSGCGAKDDAEAAFHAMMQAFRTGNEDAIRPYYDLDAVLGNLKCTNLAELKQEILKNLAKAQYEILSVEKKSGTQVSITVRFTGADTAEIMNRFAEQLQTKVGSPEYQKAVSGMKAEEYQTELADVMIKVLKQTDIPMAEKEVTVDMVKHDGTWKLSEEHQGLLQSLVSNVADAVSSLA